MCTNEDCTIKHQCYRYVAVPNTYNQSYMRFEYNKVKKQCDDKIAINGRLIQNNFYFKEIYE